MPANPTYIDGDFREPSSCSAFVKQTALEGINVLLVGQQDFWQNAADFECEDLNTPHPDDADFVLVKEDNFRDLGEGLRQWTRTYAKVPDSYDEVTGTTAYNFIGFYGIWGFNVTTITGRNRFIENVRVITTRDFFLTDTVSYPTADDIPVIQEQIYYIGTEDVRTDYLADNPPFTTESTPTRTDYEAMIAAGELIAVTSSVITRWMGNIYVRETRYVRAK